MAYIPKDTKWYISGLIIEISIENESRNVVQTNSVLVRADSPEEAYKKSLKLGEENNTTYENPDGNQVVFKFRGILDIFPIHDELEHGAELFYDEDFEVPEDDIIKMIQPKENLSIFTPVIRTEKPNYMSKDIHEELLKAGFSEDELK